MSAPEIRLGDWQTLGAHARQVRTAVFVLEQGIPAELEWDRWDPLSLHAVAYADEVPVATGRLLPDGHIGRMAVLAPERRSGVGGQLLDTLVAAARKRGDAVVELHAQSYVVAFYERHGFRPIGDEFDEVGIPHRTMRLTLTR